MEQVVKTMMALIKSEVFGATVGEMPSDILSDDFYLKLYDFSKAHDLTHIVGASLKKNGIMPEGDIGKKFEKQTFLAVLRYERLNYEYEQICSALEKNKIVYVPLKGSVIRNYYPEAWMRTSCDIDILVREEDIDRAAEAICKELGYTAEGEKHYHDISLYSSNGTHLELHFSILEHTESIDKLLSRVWDCCYAVESDGYKYLQTNEYFMFHHIAHMLYHFLNGGCGIKPFVDLCLLFDKLEYDEEKLIAYCDECGISKFYFEVKRLATVWFGGEEHDVLTIQMEEYVFTGGVYGNALNHASVAQAKKGGKLRHVATLVWQPYSALVLAYPSLEGRKWLTWAYQIRRWSRIAFCGGIKRAAGKVKLNQSVSTEKLDRTNDMLDSLGIL